MQAFDVLGDPVRRGSWSCYPNVSFPREQWTDRDIR